MTQPEREARRAWAWCVAALLVATVPVVAVAPLDRALTACLCLLACSAAVVLVLADRLPSPDAAWALRRSLVAGLVKAATSGVVLGLLVRPAA